MPLLFIFLFFFWSHSPHIHVTADAQIWLVWKKRSPSGKNSLKKKKVSAPCICPLRAWGRKVSKPAVICYRALLQPHEAELAWTIALGLGSPGWAVPGSAAEWWWYSGQLRGELVQAPAKLINSVSVLFETGWTAPGLGGAGEQCTCSTAPLQSWPGNLCAVPGSIHNLAKAPAGNWELTAPDWRAVSG